MAFGGANRVGSVHFDVEARLDRFERDLNRARGTAQRFSRQVESGLNLRGVGANFQRTMSGVQNSIAGVEARLLNFQTAAAGVAGALAVRELTQYADSWTRITDRISLSLRAHETIEERMTSLFDVAQRGRVKFGVVADLYARVARSTRDLGLSTEELTGFTEGLAQTIRISGATAAEGSNALIQFGQGLASGRLQGEELRSVMEGLPRLTQALVDGLNETAPALNATVGNLRELAAAGELTAERVVVAFLSQLPKLQAEFDKTSLTVSEAATRIDNALGKLIGTQDRATGASSGLAAALSSFAEVLESQKAADAVDQITEGLGRFAEIAGRVLDFFRNLGEGFRGFSAYVSDAATSIRESVESLPGVGGLFKQAREAISASDERREANLAAAGSNVVVSEAPVSPAAITIARDAGSVRGYSGSARHIEVNPATGQVLNQQAERASISLEELRAGLDSFREKIDDTGAAFDLFAAFEDLEAAVRAASDAFNADDLRIAGAADVPASVAAGQAAPFDAGASAEVERNTAGIADNLLSAQAAAGLTAGAMTDIALRGADAEEVFQNMLQRIGEMILQALIFRSIMAAIGGPTVGGASLFAKGGVNAPGVSPTRRFARGGVTRGPEIFPMASGGIGLRGEAGPEAILPLSTMPGGKLGVSAKISGEGGGGGATFNIDARGAVPGVEANIYNGIVRTLPLIKGDMAEDQARRRGSQGASR